MVSLSTLSVVSLLIAGASAQGHWQCSVTHTSIYLLPETWTCSLTETCCLTGRFLSTTGCCKEVKYESTFYPHTGYVQCSPQHGRSYYCPVNRDCCTLAVSGGTNRTGCCVSQFAPDITVTTRRPGVATLMRSVPVYRTTDRAWPWGVFTTPYIYRYVPTYNPLGPWEPVDSTSTKSYLSRPHSHGHSLSVIAIVAIAVCPVIFIALMSLAVYFITKRKTRTSSGAGADAVRASQLTPGGNGLTLSTSQGCPPPSATVVRVAPSLLASSVPTSTTIPIAYPASQTEDSGPDPPMCCDDEPLLRESA